MDKIPDICTPNRHKRCLTGDKKVEESGVVFGELCRLWCGDLKKKKYPDSFAEEKTSLTFALLFGRNGADRAGKSGRKYRKNTGGYPVKRVCGPQLAEESAFKFFEVM
ncbi:hypothetical protein [Algoriphagus hitonicola]|uniref:Uncharacterized protein n=1 Tax=Algoriphagus hitonicola TaxID=435880 RepID=A0A1I2WXV5_9BACT|nr:hypothetical protein SAMN04487988_1151 [Algoriphagus hitonicola]